MCSTPLREALDGFFERAQQTVAGRVRLRLSKGNLTVLSRQSPYSLSPTALASFRMDGYNPKDAAGFINLLALSVIPRRGE